MEEILILKLTECDIRKIFFDYYKINEETDKAEFEILIKSKGKKKEAIFKILQTKKINSLFLESQIMLTQEDLNRIVDFELADKGYEVNDVNYEFDYNSSNNLILDNIQLKLKKKEKVKTKKRGWKRNV